MAPSAKTPNMGQVIEYLAGEFQAISLTRSCRICAWYSLLINFCLGRLYLGSYLNPPDADTLFPYSSAGPNSPSKRSRAATTTAAAKSSSPEPYYFTVDNSLIYRPFHEDFGPLHVGHLYRFALHFHEILAATETQQRPVVFWSAADPRSVFLSNNKLYQDRQQWHSCTLFR